MVLDSSDSSHGSEFLPVGNLLHDSLNFNGASLIEIPRTAYLNMLQAFRKQFPAHSSVRHEEALFSVRNKGLLLK